MTGTFRSAWLLCALLFAFATARSQGFDYTLTSSAGTYQQLTGSVNVAGNAGDWSTSSFILPVGFEFQFEGKGYDTITIEPNGLVRLDAQHAIVIFHGAKCKRDSSNAYSLLSYSLTGTAGNRIMKMQYNNTGYDPYNSSEYLNYQLWLYEQGGKIEVRTGSVSWPSVTDSTYEGPTPLIGLINPEQSTSVSAFLLSGAPSAQPVNAGSPLLYLVSVPAEGSIYTFTPNSN
jgi:hypothetical protein